MSDQSFRDKALATYHPHNHLVVENAQCPEDCPMYAPQHSHPWTESCHPQCPKWPETKTAWAPDYGQLAEVPSGTPVMIARPQLVEVYPDVWLDTDEIVGMRQNGSARVGASIAMSISLRHHDSDVIIHVPISENAKAVWARTLAAVSQGIDYHRVTEEVVGNGHDADSQQG